MESWGEFGPLLEQAILTSLLLSEDAQPIRVTLEGEDWKRLHILSKPLSDSRYAANKTTYLSWAKFFEEG